MREIGVVTALPGEASTLTRRPTCDRLRVEVSGVGVLRATRSAEQLLADGATALVSWGVAGGLSDVLKPGDLVLVERIDSNKGMESTTSAWNRLLQRALAKAGVDVLVGKLWSDDHAVVSVHEKQRLSLRGYDIVDMEAAAVARVAHRAGVPFVAIKCVCDPASRAIPSIAAHLLRPDGHVRFLMLAAIVLRGPRAWQALRCMRDDFHAACAGLSRVAPLLVQACPP